MNIIWFKAAGMRALKTFAQTAVALIGTSAVGLLDVGWVGIASGAALAAILSMLTSLGGIPETTPPATVYVSEVTGERMTRVTLPDGTEQHFVAP
jgi:hypothetical protein